MRPRLSLVIASALGALGAPTTPARSADGDPLPDGLYAVWHTPRGTITARLFHEQAPLTVANFVGLAEGTLPYLAEAREGGGPYFDGLVFHRVVPGFVVQGGDPLGTGEGGPGYMFADEFRPELKHDVAGVLAMANAGPNTNGSQFYFTLGPVTRLDYKHTVFGRVVRGLDVLPLIEQGDAMERVAIVRVGAAALAFRPDPEGFAHLRETTRVIPARNPELPPLFEDTVGLELPEWLPDWLGEKLHNYSAVTGVTIRVRIMSKFPVTPGAPQPHNPLRALHESLAGEGSAAATLVFLAGESRWRVWLSDALLPRFGLSAEAVGEEPGATHLHELKTAILAEARAHLEAGIPRRSVDAAVSALIDALDRPERYLRPYSGTKPSGP